MLSDAQLTHIIWDAITPYGPDEEGDVVRWLRDRNWVIPQDDGDRSLATMSLEALTYAASDASVGLGKWLLHLYRQAVAQGQAAPKAPKAPQEPESEPRPVPEPSKPQAAPKPRQEPKPQEPRQEVDDETLMREVLEFLRDHRGSDYTYNDIKDEFCLADFRQASRVLRRLRDGSAGVIEYRHATRKTRDGKPVMLFKFAPERRLMDQDYSRAQELVGGAILSFLASEPHQGYNAICAAMRKHFGFIADQAVRSALTVLVDNGDVTCAPGPRRGIIHSIPAGDDTMG